MASGVPVVAVARGGVLDVVNGGENGLLVTDTGEIAASLARLRGDPALRNRLIEGGLRTVREKFSWDVVLPQYRQLLEI
jgi:glycosyltransferase involved in cell wall biosynthesis